MQPKFFPDRPSVPESVLTTIEATITPLLTTYNDLIGDREYVVTDHLTLVDFVLGLELITLVSQREAIEKNFANLARYFKNLKEKHGVFQVEDTKYQEVIASLAH